MKHRLAHLDCLRGVAALLVCLDHLRAFLFVPFTQLKKPGLVEKGFYLVTGLGHQAVMIFFVLSGFLVGGSVISAHQNRRWSWRGYLLRRLTRLWVVLIPALMLTLLWDGWGQHQSPLGYAGAFHGCYHSGPTPTAPTDLHWSTMLGNAAFLQTICVHCYGTDGPLWSLANEFWYYLLFPLALGIFKKGRWPTRLVSVLLTVGLLAWLPREILLGGIVWLLGAGVFVLIQSHRGHNWSAHPLWICTGLLLALGTLVASRMGKLVAGSDLLIGAAFAVLVAALAVRAVRSGIYTKASSAASEISYTLYLVHFPLLAFLFFVVFGGHQIQPGFVSTIQFALLLAGVLLYATGIWWCFERNTDRVRAWVQTRLGSQRSAVGSQ